ncbi:MAG TPA: N-acetyltransferase [Deltaproteobacteria bacterium]|nr:N-acetyltransferase [Deltaproteobacteria bacterium]
MLRKAKISDVKHIHSLLNMFAREGLLLPRSLSELYDSLRDFFVYCDEDKRILGCSALHICWEDLAEVRSLAVHPEYHQRGIGNRLVQACLEEARELEISRVFVLTYQEKFFSDIGFKKVDKSVLPHKVWGDCLKCPKFPNCDEIAMIINVD